ncbi:MAG: hypothetical protein M3136_03130 [Thermoproteota archaeon]|nr:hypothetical protein [Thermoproteota archaeon]MDQ4017016.1 hypothetical protein [Thermoproteota archaeon]
MKIKKEEKERYDCVVFMVPFSRYHYHNMTGIRAIGQDGRKIPSFRIIHELQEHGWKAGLLWW